MTRRQNHIGGHVDPHRWGALGAAPNTGCHRPAENITGHPIRQVRRRLHLDRSEGVTEEGTRIMQQGAHVICLQQIQWSIDGDRTITGSCGRWVGEPRDVIGDG